ncbi:MAG: hypothetical protein VB099_16415 [Candidatus Limiplasma sp.]|nr:hypothetical protein [Candidatus Limiplasma sp.]
MKREEAAVYLQDCLENELFTDDEAEAIRALLVEYTAAVKDLQTMADGNSCDVCKHAEQPNCENRLHYTNIREESCFEWRGPEPGGEGCVYGSQ